ncbi:MAG TPA: hypothetical protein PLL92_13150 [Alicycliphilus sp.]|nr:hypothetical protein [Alicycliphilus sp.]
MAAFFNQINDLIACFIFMTVLRDDRHAALSPQGRRGANVHKSRRDAR